MNVKLLPYIKIARPDHWFKNVFMLPGVVLVDFFDAHVFTSHTWVGILLGLLAASLTASSNYVINEILDAGKDKFHPDKQNRPIPRGEVWLPAAYAEWFLLGAAGIGLGFFIAPAMGWMCLLLWVMGLLYNVPPIRTKDQPYADVLSESINNPIRLALGWYSTGTAALPPVSALLAYWMFGAFLMAMKRMAEYRHIGDPAGAASYRHSFEYYTEERLIESLCFYGALFGMLSGVFIARYKLELVLATPFVAFAMAYYMHLGFKPDSPVQYPEKLYRQRKLMLLTILAFGACAALLFMDIPALHAALSATKIAQ